MIASRKELYSRIITTLDWLSFLVNKKVISDKRMIEYMKPTLMHITKIHSHISGEDIPIHIMILENFIKEQEPSQLVWRCVSSSAICSSKSTYHILIRDWTMISSSLCEYARVIFIVILCTAYLDRHYFFLAQ
jgi:hypothetical protein